jgi:hypothetical protein
MAISPLIQLKLKII